MSEDKIAVEGEESGKPLTEEELQAVVGGTDIIDQVNPSDDNPTPPAPNPPAFPSD